MILIAGSDPTGKNALVRDALNNPISSLGGGLDIHDADVHTSKFSHFLSKNEAASTTLAVAGTKGATGITVADTTGFLVGDRIDLHVDAAHIHSYYTITVLPGGNVMTLDQPLFRDYPNGSEVQEVSFNMNLVGSLASPIVFATTPAVTDIIHIKHFILTMVHAAAADDGKFGGIAALANGLVVRVNRNNGESFENITTIPWKANKDAKEDFGSAGVVYTDRAPAGAYGTTYEVDFKELAGMAYRLDGSNDDMIEAIVQDDLSALTDIQAKVHGHFEG